MARSRRSLLAALSAAVAGCGSRPGSPTPGSTADASSSPANSADATTGTAEPGPERVQLDDDRVRWRVDFPADDFAGTAVADNRLFVGTREGASTPTPGESGAGGQVAALSLPAGEPVWHRSLDVPVHGGVQTHDGDLYAVLGYSTGFDGREQRIARFGPDGAPRWESKPRDAWLSVYGFDATTAYLGTGDDALGISGETTFAVDLETGAERWAVTGGDPYGGRVTDDTLYADYGGRAIASLATDDGAERWRRVVEALHTYGRAFPRAGGRLFAAIDQEDSRGIAGIDAEDGSTVWTHGLDADEPFVVTSATPVGETVIGTEFAGLLFARDAATGEARWEQSFADRVPAPLAADGTLYCSVLDGPVAAVDAEDGRELWRADGGEGYDRFTLMEETVLAVRPRNGETVVEARRTGNGSLRWRRTVPGGLQGFEQVGRTLVLVTENQSVYGLAI
ncbi:MAG: PQQ-binding-like beta-propeller repeat protein [Halolamina sp.]